MIQAAWESLQAFLAQGGFRIPLLSEIERELQLGQKVQSVVIATALKAGNLRQISPKRVTLPEVLQRLAGEIRRLAVQQGGFTVIEAKTHLGLGRDLTIEILEYFDGIKFTQRQGNSRRVMDAASPGKLFDATDTGRAMSPVGHLVFKTREAPIRCLVGSTPTSSAKKAENRLAAYRRSRMEMTALGSGLGTPNIQRASQALSQADFEAEDLRDRMSTQRGQWSGQARERDPDLLSSQQTRQLAGQIAGLERQLASLQVNDTGQENLGSLRLGIVRKRNELESELSANAARALPDLPDDVRQALVAYRLTQADLAGVEARRQWLAGQVASYQSSVLSGPGTQTTRRPEE